MALESLWLLILLVFLFGFFLHAHPKKWQNNQRIDGGRILVEVEVEIEVEGTLYPSGAHELTGRSR